MALLKEATNINISAKWSFANFCIKKTLLERNPPIVAQESYAAKHSPPKILIRQSSLPGLPPFRYSRPFFCRLSFLSIRDIPLARLLFLVFGISFPNLPQIIFQLFRSLDYESETCLGRVQ
jgi:hypothetical protein